MNLSYIRNENESVNVILGEKAKKREQKLLARFLREIATQVEKDGVIQGKKRVDFSIIITVSPYKDGNEPFGEEKNNELS